MSCERIDLISSYCDRWCERCGFTDRCSLFACQAAAAMCGDFAQGLELAVGVPQPVDGETRQPTVGEQLLAELAEHPPSAAMMEEIGREEDARQVRVDAAPLTALARDYSHRSTEWLAKRREGLAAAADPILFEALEVVAWDAYLVRAKLRRALHGLDEYLRGESWQDDQPVQNDWNGSAKVALISLKRSQASWQVIADATDDVAAADLARMAAGFCDAISSEFPRASEFVRPGFDEADG
jgi:hypothetical protein